MTNQLIELMTEYHSIFYSLVGVIFIASMLAVTGIYKAIEIAWSINDKRKKGP